MAHYRSTCVLVLLVSELLSGCSLLVPSSSDFTFEVDAADGGHDAGMPRRDAGPGVDASMDAGRDAGFGPGDDAGSAEPCDPSTRLCGVEDLCVGATFGCALTVAGSVYCWGDIGGTLSLDRPTRIDPLDASTQIACGTVHACALTGAGVRCWGFNQHGELGDGTRMRSATPVPPSGLGEGPFRSIVAGANNTCVVSTTGQLTCWGSNFIGQLGEGVPIGEDRLTPVPVANVFAVDQLGIGSNHMCARSGGNISCWGNNFHGQLGDGTRDNSSIPVHVSGISDARAMATGGLHNCVVHGDGGVSCWGINEELQLGSSVGGSLQTLPVSTLDVGGATWILAAQGGHTCAGPSLYCWGGENSFGELGDGSGSFASRPVPAAVAPPFVARLVPGYQFTCVLEQAGGVSCWGTNESGQLGDGTTSPHLSATPVANP